MTVSNSRSIWVLASAFSRTILCRKRSSFIFAILSSLVIEFLFRGTAMASKISSSETSIDDGGRLSPLRILRASEGLPPTAVWPPRLNVGDIGDLISMEDREENLFGLSQFNDRAALPTSHSCKRAFRSAPTESYCVASVLERLDSSSSWSRLPSDSSLRTWIFAGSGLMPGD